MKKYLPAMRGTWAMCYAILGITGAIIIGFLFRLYDSPPSDNILLIAAIADTVLAAVFAGSLEEHILEGGVK